MGVICSKQSTVSMFLGNKAQDYEYEGEHVKW
jgi:hypothetical protein